MSSNHRTWQQKIIFEEYQNIEENAHNIKFLKKVTYSIFYDSSFIKQK